MTNIQLKLLTCQHLAEEMRFLIQLFSAEAAGEPQNLDYQDLGDPSD